MKNTVQSIANMRMNKLVIQYKNKEFERIFFQFEVKINEICYETFTDYPFMACRCIGFGTRLGVEDQSIL